jgi:hypothetical protein
MLLFIILPVEAPMELLAEFPIEFIELLPIAAFIGPPVFGIPPFMEFPIIIELLFIELFIELPIGFPMYGWLRPLEEEAIIGSCGCCIDGIPI